MSPIEVQKDLRHRFGPIRDQGARPTCLAFAASDTHAATREPWSDLSCEYLFYQSKRHDGTSPSTAARLSSTQTALEHDGQPVESAWEYLDAVPTDPARWVPPTEPTELFRRRSTAVGGGFAGAWAAVMADAPALVGLSFSNAFLQPDAAGVVESAEAVDPQRRHAVVAAAAGERAGTKYLLVRNSWGRSWGLAGYAWLAEPYAAPRVLAVVTLH